MNKLLLVVLFIGLGFGLEAQNLDKIGKKDMVTVSGGLNSSLVYNQSINQQQLRDPFSWVLSGNFTVSILDVSLPFTFSFSNAGRSYSQPFNITALHPTYKNWKAHVGMTSMTFSQYTYQGLNFAGGGLEYTPKKWKFKGFGGRLRKPVEYDAVANNVNSVSYRRWGFGFASEYQGSNFGTEIILFKGYDDPTSLQFFPNNDELTAKDNIVASVKANGTLFGKVQLMGEYALSILTQDVLLDDPSFEKPFYSSLVRGNQSTITSSAYNGSINYKLKSFTIGVKYERIDPFYSTLGAVYFNNDLENITVNPSLSLFKNKVNLQVSTGYQRNNLDNNNVSDMKRWIANVGLSAQLAKGLNFNANYSNLSSFTRTNPGADPFYNAFADTMNYYQISQNMSSTLSYSFGEKVKQAMVVTGSYSQSENITGRLENAEAFGFNVNTNDAVGPVDIYNGLLSHRFQLTKKGVSIGYSINGNHSIATSLLGPQTTSYIGPGLNASSSFFDKKLSMNTGLIYNQQYGNSVLTNHVLNSRLGFRYSPKFKNKKIGSMSMGLNGSWVNRLAVAATANTQTINVMFNIGYQF